jgi:hypothetical protein
VRLARLVCTQSALAEVAAAGTLAAAMVCPAGMLGEACRLVVGLGDMAALDVASAEDAFVVDSFAGDELVVGTGHTVVGPHQFALERRRGEDIG